MNKEQIIDEAYKNYKTKTEIMMGHGFHGILLTQEEFINRCKTDDALSIKWREEYRDFRYGSKEEIEHLSKHYKTNPEFSKTWGLKIEERELKRLERIQLGLKAGWKPKGYIENFEHEDLDGWNIPTKLITITYNNETIESYE